MTRHSINGSMFVFFFMQEYRGIIDDNRASQNMANQAMIRRFNQHSTMVLRVCDTSVQSETSGVFDLPQQKGLNIFMF